MKNPKFEKRISTNDKQYFVLLAKNGKVILTSELYNSTSGLKNGINSVRENSIRPNAFHKVIGADGQYYFNLIAKNNKVIGVSEGYSTKFMRFFGIRSVQRNAPIAGSV